MALLEYLPPPEGTSPVWWPISDKQRTAIESPAKLLLFGGGSGGGKRLDVNTPIPTVHGWCAMGDLRAGDVIFSDKGEACRVTNAYNVVVGNAYRVCFDDGTSIVADADHLWVTFTAADRKTLGRCNDEARARRRAHRPIRALDSPKKPGTQASVTRLNRERQYTYRDAPQGGVRTTVEILETLRTTNSRNALNHAVPVCGPLECAEVNLPLPPYTLGAWLGDGSHMDGRFTCADPQIIEEIRGDGFRVDAHAHPQSWGIWRWRERARRVGVLGNKHVPEAYLRASARQRLALLQGLMDTTGNCDVDGKAEFNSTRKCLADAVYELVCSLGMKPARRVFEAKLKGKSCGSCWRVSWTGSTPVFRLQRKLDRVKKELRGIQRWRFITAVEKVDNCRMRCIAVDSPSRLYLAGTQMVPTHNTDLLVADAVQEVGNPNLRGLLLRKSFTEMNNIIDRMMAIYRPLGGHPSDGGKMWKFPSGAQIRLGYLAADADVEKYQGSPFTWLGVDEAGNQMEKRLRAILPWLASTDPTLRVRARLTANPGGVGADWLMRLFLKDKCPIHYPEESVEPGALYRGKNLTWTDGRPLDPTGKTTVSFIPALVGDNPLYGEEKIAMLQSQEGAVSEKLLMGCWCALAGRYFNFLTPAHILPFAENPALWWNTFLISIDYGFGESWAAAGLYYVSEPSLLFPEGRMFKIGECLGVDPETGEKLGSEDFANLVIKTFVLCPGAGRREITAAYCDPANDGHTGNGRSNMEIMGEVFCEHNIPMLAAHKDRVANWQNLYRMLKKGQVVITDTCPITFKSLNTRMHDPDKPGDIKKVKGNYLDDIADETSYSCNTYFVGDAKPKEVQRAERLAEYVASGMDEHSLNIHRQKMQMEADDESDGGFEPVRMTRVGSPRVMRRR